VRVLALFEGFLQGIPASIPEQFILDQTFPGLEFVGIVATLQGLEGLFAQCGWFANDDLDWFWVRITEVQSLHLRTDSRFRGGYVLITCKIHLN
jgi:hypothetical protein